MGVMVGEEKTAAPDNAVDLEMFAALAAPEAQPAETLDAFLTGVSTVLKASDEADAELAAILSDHLLTVTPHANAVANAKAAIEALAAKRAAPTGEQADG